MRSLERVSLGFEPDGLVAFNIALPRRVGETDDAFAERRRAEQPRLMDALRNTPGVTGAAFASRLPVGVCGGTPIYVEGRPPDAPEQRVCPVRATPDLFSTLRIPLRAGRLLNESDRQLGDGLAVVINEAAARAYWSGRNPIGASVRISALDNPRFEVVGVVGDVRNSGLNRQAAPEIYVPAAALVVNTMNVVVRSELPADQLIAAVRSTIMQADPTLVMENVRTIHDIVVNNLQLERLSSLVMTFFGLAALLMATLGIYGVVSYFVRQRTVELGTRMALGAVTPRSRGARTRRRPEALAGGRRRWDRSRSSAASRCSCGTSRSPTSDGCLLRGPQPWSPWSSAAATSVPAWRTTLISPMVADARTAAVGLAMGASAGCSAPFATSARRVGGDDSGSDVSPADVLTAFVDAARGADSYTRRTARCARQRVRRAGASNRPRCSSGATARRRTTAASSPRARSKRPHQSWPPTDS